VKALAIAVLVLSLFASCGRRRCEPRECKTIRNQHGEVTGTQCPDDCEP